MHQPLEERIVRLNGRPMPSKSKGGSRDWSGIAATVFPLREKIAPYDTPEYRKKAGELIAVGARTSRKRQRRPRKAKAPTDSSESA
jgi:hypothetical protein